MNKTQISVAVAAVVLGAASLVFAADATIKVPLNQSTSSLGKNVTRDSDSKELNNASTRIEQNQDRLETKKAARAEKRLDAEKRLGNAKRAENAEKTEKAEKVEQVEKAERAEKAERVEKVERVENVERPEKVERVEKVERPEKVERSGPGH